MDIHVEFYASDKEETSIHPEGKSVQKLFCYALGAPVFFGPKIFVSVDMLLTLMSLQLIGRCPLKRSKS